ncbi:MAG: rod shape-determining protein MreD [Candidatus Omnitrophica bacterium]|nr:rod shape-determining protein MreD [Candidatus Omnitrophota bacterium]
MSWPRIIITLVIISVLEAGSRNYIKLLGVSPELVLIGVLFFSLNSDKGKAAACGFTGGLLEMAFSGAHPLILILYAAIGYAAGSYTEALYRHLASAQMIIAAVAAVSSALIYDLLIFSAGFPYYKAVFFLAIPAAIYTSLLAPPVFKALEFFMPSIETDYKEIVFKKKVFEGRRPQ